MEKLPDDMDYLAERGYEEVPGAKNDVQKLKQQWRKKHGLPPRPSTLFYAGITVMIILMALTAWLFNLKPRLQEPDTAATTTNYDTTIIHLEEVVALPEKFRKPAESASQNKTAPATASNPQTHDTLQVEMLSPRNSEPDKHSNTANEKIGFAFNSNVYYIQQLKVSDYYQLYFNGAKAIPLSGTPADANGNNTGNTSTRLKQEAPVYVHEELARALRLFREGRYAECQALLLQVAAYNKGDVNCNFYLGMCSYYRHTYSVAIEHLDQCLGSPNNTFWEEAAFYKALCWKESGEEDKAREAFKKIVNAGGFYATRAVEQIPNP